MNKVLKERENGIYDEFAMIHITDYNWKRAHNPYNLKLNFSWAGTWNLEEGVKVSTDFYYGPNGMLTLTVPIPERFCDRVLACAKVTVNPGDGGLCVAGHGCFWYWILKGEK